MSYFPTTNTTANQICTTNTTIPNGAYITSTGTSANWSNTSNEALRISQTNPPTLQVKGNMVINGRDLEERLETIEKVLNIPERDVILEAKHPKLKKLYDAYIKELSKYRMWEDIKGEDNGTT